MFTNKSFNLSNILSRSKDENRVSSVLEPKNDQNTNDIHENELKKLRQQNAEIKQQLEKLKQLFIETRIRYDTEIRASDQLVEQLRNQLGEKDDLLEKYYESMKNENGLQDVKEQVYQDQDQHVGERVESEERNNKLKKTQSQEEISELMIQSTICFKQKYEASLHEIEILKLECEKLKNQLMIAYEKNNNNIMMNTNDLSFAGKSESKISFDFGDITAELRDVEEIAQFSQQRSQITVDQQEINVREERIENLQRQNFQLQHELASKSHKLARIFNAAFEFGGMDLLDYLQSSIGLIENVKEEME